MRWIRILLGMATLAAFGCQSKLADENKALWDQNRELQARVNDSETRLRSAPDPATLASLQSANAAKDQEIARLQESLRQQPAVGPKDPTLEGIDATYDPRAGTVTVNLPGDVLFAPGQADVKASAMPTLDKIVNAIEKSYAGKPISIDGHTDSDPISRTKNIWDDNFDLSYARAKAVMKYLTEHGVSEKQVSLRAFGPNKPKGGKASSRRVEIVVATR